MIDSVNRRDAIDAVYDAFRYAYCDNCEKELDEDLCGDCHRKYQNWSASKETVEKVINALPSAQPYTINSDGRLWITVDDIDKVTAVVVDEHKSKFCKQFYVDAEPDIIRCKDCKHAHITYGGEVKYCDVWFPDESHYIDTDNYCSFGERKEDE